MKPTNVQEAKEQIELKAQFDSRFWVITQDNGADERPYFVDVVALDEMTFAFRHDHPEHEDAWRLGGIDELVAYWYSYYKAYNG